MVRTKSRVGGAHSRSELESDLHGSSRTGKFSGEQNNSTFNSIHGTQVDERGVSLRFPRFIRIRDDKSADDATGPEQVNTAQAFNLTVVINDNEQIAEMYERQSLAQTKSGKKRRGEAEDDFW